MAPRGGAQRRVLPRRLGLLNPELRVLADEVSASLQAAAGIPQIGASNVNRDMDETRSEAGFIHSTRNEQIRNETNRSGSWHAGASNAGQRRGIEHESAAFNETDSLLAELGQRSLRARNDIAGHDARITAMEKLTKKLEAFDTRLLNANNRNAAATTQNAYDLRRIDQAQVELAEKQGAVQERLTNIDARLDTHVDQINAITDNVNALSDRINGMPLTHAGGQQAQTCALARFKIDLPTFSAAPCDQPVQFIRKILHYFEATRVQEVNFHIVIDQALRGAAHDWWVYAGDHIRTMREFKDKFLNKYSNHVVQDRVRQELEFGFYRADNNLSKSEYATRLYNKVIMLDDPPNEKRIVERFSRHFDEQVQQAVLARNIKTMDSLFELLDNLEQIGLLNATRNTSYQDFNKSSQDARRYGEYDRSRYTNNYPRDPRYNGMNNRPEWRARSPAPHPQAPTNESFRASTPRPFDNDRNRARGNSMERRPDYQRQNENRNNNAPPQILKRSNSQTRVNEINVSVDENDSAPPTEN